MAFEPTLEQKNAINENGSIIVSAAAGSGKTAVLVERVIRMLSDTTTPVMADKLLVVTFTNAAAAELRFRIEKRISEELRREPDNYLLQKQQILLNNAKICTIDSFCIDFLKENFEAIGISPSFKIADNTTLRSLEKSALRTVLNEYFENNDELFLKLLDFLGDDYDDSTLQKTVNSVFSFSRNMPFPKAWLDNSLKQYELHSSGKTILWFDKALECVRDISVDANIEISQGISLLEGSSAYEKYSENFLYFKSLCSTILKSVEECDWNGIFALVSQIKAPSLKRLLPEEKNAEVVAAVELRDNTKKLLSKIKNIVYANREDIVAELGNVVPFISKIVEIVNRFEEKLYGLLLEQELLTFYLAEQTVLGALAYEENGSVYQKSDISGFTNLYDAILVDEYQDTNTLQDTLFNILSCGGEKLFCVGDMKQCIYKFRGSNPLNFLNKKNSAKPIDARKSDDTLRINLGCNFRSREEICDFVNSVFSKLIYKENSDFDYDKNEMLLSEAKFPVSDATKVENHFVDCSDFDFKTTAADRIAAEANVVADIILKTVSAEPFLRDGDKLRKAQFNDIAVLVRSMRGKGEAFIKAFKERGIPVALSSSDALDSDEVSTLISVLKVINNPSDDISLVTAMTSPIFSFTLNELADMRSGHKYGQFYSAVLLSAKNGNLKAKTFIDVINRLRRKSALIPLGVLIDEVFEATNLLNFVSAQENGEIKRLNLLCVQNMANSFEEGSSQDLRAFLKYFDSLENRDFSLSNESDGSVRLMTIHKSKGLQFPVCIVANTSVKFNEMDLKDSVILNESYGFSCIYYDENSVKKDNSVLRSVMKNEEKKNLLAEELRVFYVALTRAEEKLITVSTYDDLSAELFKKHKQLKITESEKRIEYPLFRKNSSYADWLIETLILDGKYEDIRSGNNANGVFLHKGNEMQSQCEEKLDEATKQISEDAVANLKAIYSYSYPYSEILELEAKSSVTELVHKADDKTYRFTRRPSVMQNKGLNSAERGTAVHKVMQRADFLRCKDDLDNELDALLESMFLSEEEYNSLDKSLLSCFFNGALCKRITDSSFVKKEMKFLTEFPAFELKKELSETLKDELVVVQGAVDLIFEEDGELVIVDFKTDRNKNPEELIKAYSEQLKIYSKACEKLLKKKVKELILYSFDLGQEIIIK